MLNLSYLLTYYQYDLELKVLAQQAPLMAISLQNVTDL